MNWSSDISIVSMVVLTISIVGGFLGIRSYIQSYYRERVHELEDQVKDLRRHITDNRAEIATLHARTDVSEIASLLQNHELRAVERQETLLRLGNEVLGLAREVANHLQKEANSDRDIRPEETH